MQWLGREVGISSRYLIKLRIYVTIKKKVFIIALLCGRFYYRYSNLLVARLLLSSRIRYGVGGIEGGVRGRSGEKRV